MRTWNPRNRPFPSIDLAHHERAPRYWYQGSDGVRIYALVDPDDRTVRYVGMTRRHIYTRAAEHMRADQSRPEMREWVRGLRRDGKRPIVRTLGVASPDKWHWAERQWIGYFRNRGALYNIHAGGSFNFKDGKKTPGQRRRDRANRKAKRRAEAKANRYEGRKRRGEKASNRGAWELGSVVRPKQVVA